ncbi:hemerythrin domain-containing protein [Streptomyces sp. NPDC058874]|uniref:hemerythrin domain-containing protein n=1 Tax=unclassified Streptomyces TaxID=2593676 RepID=UPI0036B8D039
MRAHHTGEDAMLRPVLLPHLDLDAEQVPAMEAQHRELSAGIREVQALIERWQAQALSEDRDELAEALRRHHRQLCAPLSTRCSCWAWPPRRPNGRAGTRQGCGGCCA